jgi:hypothetical protein
VFKHGTPSAPAYALLNETAFEVYRGFWLKVSPQLLTENGDTGGGTMRWVLDADLLPRTHWNVEVGWYRDHARATDVVVKTWLLQVHLYL